LKCLKYYTFLDNQAAILRKVAMLGMCTALTVSAAAPPLYPGGGGEKWKIQLLCTAKISKIYKKNTQKYKNVRMWHNSTPIWLEVA